TITLSPSCSKLTNDAYIAPVPELAKTSTSCFVWNSHCRPSRTRAKTCSNSGDRWWAIGCAIRSASRSGTGVGPGVRRRIFFMASSSRCARWDRRLNAPCQAGIRRARSLAGPPDRQRSAEAVRERRALVPVAVRVALEALAGLQALAADEVAGLRDLVASGRRPSRRPSVASVELHAREDVTV